jgi:hypothetical protein
MSILNKMVRAGTIIMPPPSPRSDPKNPANIEMSNREIEVIRNVPLLSMVTE